jgi:arylsulfatase A-like enzyme
VLSGKEAHLGGLRPQEVLVSEMLRDAGYKSAMVGKWHLGVNPAYRPLRRGFDEFFGMLYGAGGYFTHSYKGKPDLWKNNEAITREGYSTELFTEAAVDFIRRHRDAPFFLYLAYNAPHIADDLKSLPAPDKYKAIYKQADIPDRRREYLSVVSALDAGVGEIVRCIDELGLDKNTIVVFLSDNGAGWKFGGSNLWLRGGKNSLDEGGIRVPCVFRWTDRLPAGTVCHEPMIAMDITRTMIDLAAAQSDKRILDGKNILPTLEGRARTPHKYLFWDYREARALRVGSDRWTRHPNLVVELNDLSKDPQQAHNLAGERPEKCDQMSQSWDHIARLIDAGKPLPDDLP